MIPLLAESFHVIGVDYDGFDGTGSEFTSMINLITPLGDNISAQGTQIHIFYALKMGEKYRKRYLQHFADPDIIEQDYGHEELLFFYPEKWAEEVKRCTGN